jgi:CBS-domain-containing membrane protein
MGTLVSLFSDGSLMAIVAAVLAFGVINLIHAYHPPGLALGHVSLVAPHQTLVSPGRRPSFYPDCCRICGSSQ